MMLARERNEVAKKRLSDGWVKLSLSNRGHRAKRTLMAHATATKRKTSKT
jgi:hypothetical protein